MVPIYKSTISQLVGSCERRTTITLTMVFALTITALFGQTKQKNDWSDMKLIGNIKTIKETDYGVKQEILETFGDIQPSVLIASRTYTFNAVGNITEYNSYYANGDLNRKSIYTYDSLGHAIENSSYNKKDILVTKTTYEYDSAGNLEEEKSFNDVGNLTGEIIRNYDANGNCIEKNSFNPDGKLVSKSTSQYDGYGDITEHKEYNKKGKEIFNFTFKYDGNKNIVEKSVFDARGGIVGQIVYYYSFDKNGNWIQKITFFMDLSQNTATRNDVPQSITKREIEYL
jgi:hypothetical protein